MLPGSEFSRSGRNINFNGKSVNKRTQFLPWTGVFRIILPRARIIFLWLSISYPGINSEIQTFLFHFSFKFNRYLNIQWKWLKTISLHLACYLLCLYLLNWSLKFHIAISLWEKSLLIVLQSVINPRKIKDFSILPLIQLNSEVNRNIYSLRRYLHT